MTAFMCCKGNGAAQDVSDPSMSDSIADDDDEMKIEAYSDKDIWFHHNEYDGDEPVCVDLIDMYNCARVRNTIFCDVDTWMRFDDKLEESRRAIEKMDFSEIRNTVVKPELEAYRRDMLLVLGADAATLNSDEHNPWLLMDRLSNAFYERFDFEKYVHFEPDVYHETYYTCDRIKDWEQLRERRGDGTLYYQLQGCYEKETDFDARCVYAIEIAHAARAGVEGCEEDLCEKTITMMESLMNEKKYSMYLFEVWRIWRNMLQDRRGKSRDSWIPNDEYNRMRLTCARTVLSYISEHPKDPVAVYTFTAIASVYDIYRSGAFAFGNQNNAETMEIFPEWE